MKNNNPLRNKRIWGDDIRGFRLIRRVNEKTHCMFTIAVGIKAKIERLGRPGAAMRRRFFGDDK